jgi:hypothetical protein
VVDADPSLAPRPPGGPDRLGDRQATLDGVETANDGRRAPVANG